MYRTRSAAISFSLSVLALLAGGAALSAQTPPACIAGTQQTIVTTDSVQTYTVPVNATALYIVADGAGPLPGGFGAHIGAEAPVTGPATLNVVVGGIGQFRLITPWGGSGGGGSFVYTTANVPLVAAGGGGGTSDCGGVGQDAQLTPAGGAGGHGDNAGAIGGAGGTGGAGGAGAMGFGAGGGGGGGFFGAGGDATPNGGAGGHQISPPGDAGGGTGTAGYNGGFGGGGGGAAGGGGGGGGYSGGGGGGGAAGVNANQDLCGGGGGGGGSFVAAGATIYESSLGNSRSGLDGRYGRVTICVTQQSPTPTTLGFAATGYSQAETGGKVTIVVLRSGGSNGMVTVDYATSDGSALAGKHYMPASGTLSWADGDLSQKSFDVPVLDDGVQDGTHTVNLTLSNPTGGATLGQATAVLSITDNDHPVTPPPCVADATTLCLGGRFKTSVEWRTATMSGVGTAVPLPDHAGSGLFYFFGPDNIELLIKVINGCALDHAWWVFLSATTNVQFTVTVFDATSGKTQVYSNPLNQMAVPVQDTKAFATCP